jgi:N-acetylglucosaminyldiphosphoundecaprenol N-acetyl-beta-D-mannosaminyltransferase
VVGDYSPPFKPWAEDEDQRILQLLKESKANCVWVALGCPKQEQWLARNKHRLPPGVYLAVGAAFPLNAGVIPQAPAWMQDRGLEWIFRMCVEPRLISRFAKYNTLFLFYTFKHLVRGKKKLA